MAKAAESQSRRHPGPPAAPGQGSGGALPADAGGPLAAPRQPRSQRAAQAQQPDRLPEPRCPGVGVSVLRSCCGPRLPVREPPAARRHRHRHRHRKLQGNAGQSNPDDTERRDLTGQDVGISVLLSVFFFVGLFESSLYVSGWQSLEERAELALNATNYSTVLCRLPENRSCRPARPRPPARHSPLPQRLCQALGRNVKGAGPHSLRGPVWRGQRGRGPDDDPRAGPEAA